MEEIKTMNLNDLAAYYGVCRQKISKEIKIIFASPEYNHIKITGNIYFPIHVKIIKDNLGYKSEIV